MPVDPRVLAFAEPYLKGDFGNPSSQHSAGVAANKAVEDARKKVTQALIEGRPIRITQPQES